MENHLSNMIRQYEKKREPKMVALFKLMSALELGKLTSAGPYGTESTPEQIQALRKQAHKLDEEIPQWDSVVHTLAATLAEMTGKYAKVFGPYGTADHIFIYLVDDPDEDVKKQDSYHITLVPNFNDLAFSFWLWYETDNGQMENPASDHSYSPLPDSLDNILSCFTKEIFNKGGFASI